MTALLPLAVMPLVRLPTRNQCLRACWRAWVDLWGCKMTRCQHCKHWVVLTETVRRLSLVVLNWLVGQALPRWVQAFLTLQVQ